MASSAFHSVAQGLGFAEGPVVLVDGRIAFVDLRAQSVCVLEASGVRVLATVLGSPNGAALGPDGSLYIANNGGVCPISLSELWQAEDAIDGCIQRVDPGGAVTDFVAGLPGARPHRPNDLCFAPDGRLFFTDPVNWEVLPDTSRYRTGAIYAAAPSGQVEVMAELGEFPNGIGILPDGEGIVVAQSMAHRLLVYPLRRDGSLGLPEVYVELGADLIPDGFCFAADGTLFVAGDGGGDAIAVISPDRELVEKIPLGAGSDPTNVCLAEDGKLWVTLGLPGELGYVEVGKEPLPLLSPRPTA